jgi:hypothetical protein
MSTYFKEGENTGTAGSSNPIHMVNNWLQVISDRIHLYKTQRWLVVVILGLFFLIRLVYTKGSALFKLGYHAVAYCLGIHLLNSFIGFISPLDDPEEDELGGDSFLPTK